MLFFFQCSGHPRDLHSFPTRRSSDLAIGIFVGIGMSCTTFNIVFGALGRAYPAEKRSVVLGISSAAGSLDRKSTRLNSSHPSISYAVFCLKKKKKKIYSVVQASRSIS